jgi:hypothetical protein
VMRISEGGGTPPRSCAIFTAHMSLQIVSKRNRQKHNGKRV